MICDRRMLAKTKGKVYKTVVRPAMLYGLETVAEFNRGGRKMLRFSLGVTRMMG